MVKVSKLVIKGMSKLRSKLSTMPRSMETTYIQTMQKLVLKVRHESQLITPIRTGNLRASARSEARRKSMGSKGKVWYTADYAVPVHEKTWTKLISGQHKFLEKAVRRSKRWIAKMFIGELKTALRRGSR
jgi:hypothetical protein